MPTPSRDAPSNDEPRQVTGEAPIPVDQTILDQGQFVAPQDGDGGLQLPPIESEVDSIPSDVLGIPSKSKDSSKPGSAISFRGKRDLSDQWETKWLYIAFGVLGFLLIMGGVLYIATMGVKAEDQYAAAKDSFEKLAYLDAAKKFEEYYTANPSHKYVSSAKALRVQCLIASSFTSNRWAETITTAETLLPPLLDDETSRIEDIRDDLAHMLPESLREITDRSLKVNELPKMEAEFAKCSRLKKVVDNSVYIPTSRRKRPLTAANLTKIDNNLRILQGHIDKEKDYITAIDQIKQLGEARQTEKAFAVYKQLTRNYGDLAGREQLQQTMLEISHKEQGLVVPATDTFAVANSQRSSPILNTVVLASHVGDRVDGLKDEFVNFLAEGSVYGMRASDGAILWRRFVGYQTSTQPERFDADTLLVSDQKEHDVMLLNRSTGSVVWRTEIGEPFLAPSLSDTAIVVTTTSGKVLQIDPDSGTVSQSAKLPQVANVPALIADHDPYIYQVGSHSNLYVLSQQDLSCREVHYLGHYPGSISTPPKAWGGYILVAVNGGESCSLMVLKPSNNGLDLQLVQVLNRLTSGPVSAPMQRFGRWMLLAADNGEIRVLELLSDDEEHPVTQFAADRFESSEGQPTQLLTEGSHLWIASVGISRFRIQRTQGTFKRNEIIDHEDAFLTPLIKMDDSLFHVSRRRGSGMLSASLVDAMTLEPIWRTDFGGQVVGPPQVAGDSLVAVSNQGDVFRIAAAQWKRHRADVSVRASTVLEDLQFETLIPLPGNTFACFGPANQEDFLYAESSAPQSKLIRLSSPSNHLACAPLRVGEHVVVPSSDGQATRIDPRNGQNVGTLFQPPVAPGEKTEWLEPTLIDGRLVAIASGKGSGDSQKSMLYLLNAESPESLPEVGSLKPEFPFKSRLINDGQFVWGATEGPDNDFLVKIAIDPGLVVAHKLGLPGRVVEGPWRVGQGVLLLLDNDQLIMLAGDSTTRWTLDIPNDRLAAKPESIDAGLLLSFQSGELMVIDPSSGKVTQQHDLRQPIVHAPTRVGQRLFFSGRDGTVHEVDFTKASGAPR